MTMRSPLWRFFRSLEIVLYYGNIWWCAATFRTWTHLSFFSGRARPKHRLRLIYSNCKFLTVISVIREEWAKNDVQNNFYAHAIDSIDACFEIDFDSISLKSADTSFKCGQENDLQKYFFTKWCNFRFLYIFSLASPFLLSFLLFIEWFFLKHFSLLAKITWLEDSLGFIENVNQLYLANFFFNQFCYNLLRQICASSSLK